MNVAPIRPGEPLTDDWEHGALCASIDPELFYPTSYDSPDGLQQTADAKRICAACPVRAYCRDAALHREGNATAKNRSGIWAGLTPEERANHASAGRSHHSYRRAA